MPVQNNTAPLNSLPPAPPTETAGGGSPPVSVSGGGSVGDERPSNLLAALRSDAVVSALDADALRCVRTDLMSFARLSDCSKGRRYRWRREEPEQRLAELPCDPSGLRPIVERVMPARLRIKKSTAETIGRRWSTIKSSLHRVLRLTGWIEDLATLAAECTPEWSLLCDTVQAPGRRGNFQRFAGFCSRLAERPGDDVEAVLEVWAEWLETKTMQLNVRKTANLTRQIWNKQVRCNPEWPRNTLRVPKNPAHYPHADQVSPEYVRAVDDYLDRRRHRNPLDSLFPKRVGEASLKQVRDVLLHAASILISGGRPPASITALRDVTTAGAVKEILLDHYNRLGKGQGWTETAVYTARHLRDAARFVHAIDPSSMTADHLTKIEGFRKLIHVPNSHLLSKKTRDRLTALEDPDVEERFLRLADEAFEEADILLAGGQCRDAAYLHQAALALAMLILKAPRNGMLSLFDRKRHFHRDRRGRVTALRVPADEVEKSTVALEADVPRKISNRIARHEQVYIPIIVNGNVTTALFPNCHGKPTHRDQLAQAICELVESRIGIEFNVHLVRHWGANIILDDDPRNGPIVQHFLGQRSPMSKRRYGAPRTRSAHRKYAELLDRKVTRLRRGKGK
jgi:integrase